MRRIISLLLGMITISSASSQNWISVSYESQDVKGIPISKVRIKKGETKEVVFSKDMQVSLSEKPDGIESGYYVVHARNGFIADGDKKNKIEIGSDKMKRTSDGWYEYDFGKTLYVRKVGLFVGTEHCDPICILPADGNSASNSSSTSGSFSASKTSQGNVSQDNYFANISNMVKQSMPTITGKPYPETHNWQLVKTNTIAGFKCEHYEKGNEALRVFRKDNGDFITLLEDPDGVSREPEDREGLLPKTLTELEKEVLPFGEYRITTSDGIVVNGGFDDSYLFLDSDNLGLYNGARLLNLSVGDEYWLKPLKDYFKGGFGIKATLPNGDAYSSANIGGAIHVAWHNFKKGTFKDFTPDWIYLNGHPNERYLEIYPGVKGNPHSSGYLIGDRVYAWSDEAKSITTPIYQFFENRLYPICMTDTIVSVKRDEKEQTMTISYANGDYLNFNNLHTVNVTVQTGDAVSGELHRGGNILKIKTRNDKTSCSIEYPDGKIFIGTIGYEGFDFTNYTFQGSVMQEADVVPYTGTYEYPDGTLVRLTKGFTDEQIAAMEAEQEAQKKAEEEREKKKQQQEKETLYKKYGKKYVDVVYAGGKPIIGMPIELVKEFYDVSLSNDDSYSQIYRLYGAVIKSDGKRYWTWTSTLYVRNGRVTSITNYYK